MTGFMEELTQPSQVRTAKVISGLLIQVGQIPAMILVTKQGSQQIINIPITVPRVFAAFVSLLNFANFLDTPTPFFLDLPGDEDPSESIEGNLSSSFFFAPPPRCIRRVISFSPFPLPRSFVPEERLLL